MLRVAVPNKGSLSEAASAMLSEAGYRQRRDTRELVMVDPDNDIEFFFLRPRDIAVYVGQGTLDVGITGRDLLLDAKVEAEELLPLGFAPSTFRFAGPVGDFTGVEQLEGKRLATSYDGLLRDYLADRGVNAKVVRLDGAVRLRPGSNILELRTGEGEDISLPLPPAIRTFLDRFDAGLYPDLEGSK